MNRKQLILLIVVGLVLGGVAFYLRSARNEEFQRRDVGIGQKLLGDFAPDKVAAVTIKSRDGEVNLTKQDVWVVKERSSYPASVSQLSDLVRKLWELKPAQSQQAGQSQWGRLELLPPGSKDAGTNSATLVELKDKEGKPIRSILLGKKQMRDTGQQFGGYPVGRWVALPDKTDTVYLTSEAFSEIEPKAESWLNKDSFLKVEKLKAISLVSTNATNSWSLSRTNETGEWILADKREGEELDKSKVSSLNWAFSSPSFNDVQAKDADAVKGAFAAPTLLKLETFEGFTYEVNVGTQPDPESFYISVAAKAELPKERTAPAEEKAEDKEKNEKAWKEQQDKLKEKLKGEQSLAGWVYKVAKWTVDSVLKDRSALMVEKKPADAAAAGAGGAPPALNGVPELLAPPAAEPPK